LVLRGGSKKKKKQKFNWMTLKVNTLSSRPWQIGGGRGVGEIRAKGGRITLRHSELNVFTVDQEGRRFARPLCLTPNPERAPIRESKPVCCIGKKTEEKSYEGDAKEGHKSS